MSSLDKATKELVVKLTVENERLKSEKKSLLRRLKEVDEYLEHLDYAGLLELRKRSFSIQQRNTIQEMIDNMKTKS